MSFLTRCAPVACLWLLALPLHAANLLVNPSFDADSSGWNLQSIGTGAYGGWLPTVGRGGTGGLYATSNFPGSSTVALQCVNLSPTVIDAHVFAAIDYAPNKLYYGDVSVSTFDVPDCSASYVTNTRARTHVLEAGWVLHRIDGLELPASTQSVMLLANVAATSGSVSLYWDDAGLGPTGTTGVPPLPSNLLLNPDFHVSLFHWNTITDGDGYVIWNGSEGEPSPGSVLIQRWTGRHEVSQCVQVPAGAIDAYALSSGESSDPAALAVSFHDTNNCIGVPLATSTARRSPSPGMWTLHHLLDYTPPAGSQSANVHLMNNGIGTATMDHVAFGEAGSIGAPAQYSIGGTVSGLEGPSARLALNGIDELAIAGSGAFEFDTRLLDGESYAVTVAQNPVDPVQTCTVTAGVGVVAGADVTTVQVHCETTVLDRLFASGFEPGETGAAER